MASGTRTKYKDSNSSTTSNKSTAVTNEVDSSLTDYHSGLIALVVLIFLANLFVLQIYKRHIKVRRNLSNVLLVSLALSDMFGGVAILPFSIYCEREIVVSVDDTLAKSCRFSYMLQNFCAFSTIFHIIAVTLEKYVAVLHPLKRIYIKTSATYRKILATVWSTALILAFIPAFWIYNNPRSKAWFERFYNYAIFQIVLFFGVSLLILTYCYCRMFIQIRAKLCTVRQATRSSMRVRNERKTVVVFMMFFLIFVAGWLPWFVVTVLVRSKKAGGIPPPVIQFLISLRFTGAFFNPFVYALLKSDYKEAVESDFRSWYSKCPFVERRDRLRSFTYENNNCYRTDTTPSTQQEKIELQRAQSGSFSAASMGHPAQAEDTRILTNHGK